MFCTTNPIFGDRRFNCPRKILKTVLESRRQKEKAKLQFCSIFKSRVKLFLSSGGEVFLESSNGWGKVVVLGGLINGLK